jgi:hypothetical protein
MEIQLICIVLVRKLFSLVLISSLLFPPVLKLGVIADFYQHREFIARTLCVNKDRPEKKCNGQCHLEKQLTKTQDNEEDKKAPLPTVKTELLPGILTESFALFSQLKQSDSYIDFSIAEYSFLTGFDFFHPPRA